MLLDYGVGVHDLTYRLHIQQDELGNDMRQKPHLMGDVGSKKYICIVILRIKLIAL